MRKTLIATALGTLGALALSPAALAGHAGHTDYADVVSVSPVYRVVETSHPRRECEDREVTHRRAARHSPRYRRSAGDSFLPVLLGGIVGGVVGNQFGKGTGNVIATAAGAVVGGQVGRSIDEGHHAHGHGGGGSYTTTETVCSTVYDRHSEERLDGYRVEYRYQGRVYTTRMDHHPGDRIPVDVSVTPSR